MTRSSESQAILAQRAAMLARPQDVETHETSTVTVLVVVVDSDQGAGSARFALEVDHVRGIQRNDNPCRLPGGTGALLGVVAVHGQITPVADLADLLGLSAPDLHRPLIVVLDGHGPPLGLLVDGVAEVAQWRAAELRSVRRPSSGAAGGDARLGPHDVVLLDGGALLNDARLFVLSPLTDPVGGPYSEQENTQACDR